jgi:hypothetical protein
MLIISYSVTPHSIMVGEKSGTLESSEATPLLHTALPIVSAQECLQHQHLLRCFVNLKQTVSRKKGLFRTEHVHDINTEPDPRTRQTIVEERRWSIYVSRAIHRFSVWWACLATLRTPGFLSGQATEKPYWTTDRMPPLGKYHAARHRERLTCGRCFDGPSCIDLT